MNAEILSSNPPANLSGVPLKHDCKVALVNLTHDGINTYGMVQYKYNLRYPTLKKYFQKVRKGLPMFETSGRPPRLDEISVQFLVSHLASCNITEKADLYKIIREQNKEAQ